MRRILSTFAGQKSPGFLSLTTIPDLSENLHQKEYWLAAPDLRKS